MDENVKQWREAGKHYHPIMRDFHDAKDLFKLIHTVTNVEDHKYCGDISWVKGQCYVVDIFLWCMARYGYTLQKTRTKLNFEDIHADLESLQKNKADSLASIINKEHTI